MIVSKKLVGIEIRELMKFVDIFNIADMTRIDKICAHSGIDAGIMLSVIEP